MNLFLLKLICSLSNYGCFYRLFNISRVYFVASRKILEFYLLPIISNDFHNKCKPKIDELDTGRPEVGGERCAGIRPKLMAATYTAVFCNMIWLKHARAHILLPATFFLCSVMRSAAKLAQNISS